MNDTSQAILIRNPMAVMTGLQGDASRAGKVDIRIRNGRISEMAPSLEPCPGERVIDASDCLVYPGWINTHHHLFQNLLKAVPAGMNQDLQGWLASVPYPLLPRITPELLRIGARLGLAELLLSGTTTCADHHYTYHANSGTETGDILFEVANEFGMRFVLCRGGAIESASSHPGFSKTSMQPETLEQMLTDIERLKHRYHDDAPDAMRRVVVAPTTPTFSLPPVLLKELAHAARAMNLRLHTHLSETDNYVHFCREKYNCLPVEFVAEHEWLGPDVWFAHMVHAQPSEIRMLAQTGTGVSHCPVSNSRLGSGIAPVPQLAAAGVAVSLGVDGVASNESGSMIGEVNTAWLIHRAVQGAEATTVEKVIHWATAGGAQVLGLGKVGTLQVGNAADLVLYDINHPRFYGFHDFAVAPVVAGEPIRVRTSIINGRIVVEDGQVCGLDVAALREQTFQGVQALMASD